MLDTLISILDKSQTLVVGLLGFLGVIYTIRMNARLAREQHERQLNHERIALRTALCAELEIIRKTYEDRSQMLREDDTGQSALIPEYVPNKVYHQLLDRIGLLSTEEIESVMNAYLLVAELPVRLRLLTRDTGDPAESSGYIHIGTDYVKDVGIMHDNFLSDINLALEAIKRKLEQSVKEKEL